MNYSLLLGNFHSFNIWLNNFCGAHANGVGITCLIVIIAAFVVSYLYFKNKA